MKLIKIAKMRFINWRVEWLSDPEGYFTKVVLSERDHDDKWTILLETQFDQNPFGGDAAGQFELCCREAFGRGSRSESLSEARQKGVEV